MACLNTIDIYVINKDDNHTTENLEFEKRVKKEDKIGFISSNSSTENFTNLPEEKFDCENTNDSYVEICKFRGEKAESKTIFETELEQKDERICEKFNFLELKNNNQSINLLGFSNRDKEMQDKLSCSNPNPISQNQPLDNNLKLEKMLIDIKQEMTFRFDKVDRDTNTINVKVERLEKKVEGLERKVERLEKKVEGLEKKVEGLERKVEDLDAGLDWQFEITTRSYLQLELGNIYTKFRLIENFGDFKSYFEEVCTIEMKNFLLSRLYPLDVNLKKVYDNKFKNKKHETENQDLQLFRLYSDFRNSKRSNKKQSKSFEINIQGKIDYDPKEKKIIIEIGEVKKSLTYKSMTEAKSQLFPVIYLFYYLLEDLNVEIECHGNIYYGLKKINHKDQETQEYILYTYQKITGVK